MTNLPCECQELELKGETNSSFLVLHPLSGVHTVKTVGSHLNVIEEIMKGSNGDAALFQVITSTFTDLDTQIASVFVNFIESLNQEELDLPF